MDLETILSDISVIGSLAIIGGLVFAESAFLFGLFLPGGDTLLVISGVLAAQGHLPLVWVIAVIVIAAALGDNVGYAIGKKTGATVFKQQDGLFFRKEHAERAAQFYQKHGGKTIIIARFVAYVRTFVPLFAGIAHMPRRKFIVYNIVGALIWTLSLVLVSYWLGQRLADQIQRYILPISIAGFILLFSPSILFVVRNRDVHKKLLAWVKRIGRIVRR